MVKPNVAHSAATLAKAGPHQTSKHESISKSSDAEPVRNGHHHAHTLAASGNGEEGTNGKSIILADKIKELVRLAQEQGYLTYNDINDALPDSVINPDDLDEIYIKLRSLEVEIVDQAEVDRVKQPEVEEEEEKSRLDILDDPVRMYQIGRAHV